MMRELPEFLAPFDAISVSGFSASSATNATQGMTAPPTFFLYGYLIGEDTDPLLCGHPDLVY